MFGGMGGMGGGRRRRLLFLLRVALGGAGAAGHGWSHRRSTRHAGWALTPTRWRAPSERQVDAAVTLEEAFHGTTRVLQMEDGRRLEVNIPRGVTTGSKVRMKGASWRG